MKLGRWQVLEHRELVAEWPWVRLSVERIQLPSGKTIDAFYLIDLPDYAVVVALTVHGQVVVEWQYKHGIGEVVLTLPAGYLDEGESPLQCAQRELCEETGYMADEWKSLGTFVVNGNRGCGQAHMFLAQDAHYVTEPRVDDQEEIKVELVRPEMLLDALRQGKIRQLSTAAAISMVFNSVLHI